MGSTEWETPPELFDAWWEEFGGFDLDPFCRPEHYTSQRVLVGGGYICIPPPIEDEVLVDAPNHRILIDGYTSPWFGKVYMNPPYGSENISAALDKAIAELEAKRVELVVALLPATTDTKWWQKYLVREVYYDDRLTVFNIGVGVSGTYFDRLRFLPGRLQFVGAPGPARLSSVIVVLRQYE